MDGTAGFKVTSIVAMVKRLAEEKPDKEAFVFIDKFYNRMSLTRKELWDKCRQFAAILKRHGIEKGDIVCNTLVNSPERLVTAYGTMTAGAVTMNGQLLLTNGEDLIHNLKTGRCKAIIVDTGREKNVVSFLDRISSTDEASGEVHYQGLPFLKTVIKLRVSREENESDSGLLRDLENEEEMFEVEDLREDDITVVFNTSGTTGFSKLVPYDYRTFRSRSDIVRNMWHLTDDDVTYSNRALGWMGGFPHAYNSSGCKMVIPNVAFGQPDDMATHMIKVFEQEKCDHASLAGIEVERILEKVEKPIPHLLKYLGTGGGPVASFIERAIGVITEEIHVGYGGTEFGAVAVKFYQKGSTFKDYCAGKPMDGVEVKILDPKLEPVTRGQQGEIFVRTTGIVKSYLNDPEKSKESFLEDGWYRTGDIGYEGDEDHLFVLGRKSNAITKGSFILYPGWLEEKILKCPGIKSVAVIGVPDPILYEDICLCIVKTPDGDLTEETVREFCRSLFLTSEKEEITPMPKYFIFFDELPFNTNCKVDVPVLKKQALEIISSKQSNV